MPRATVGDVTLEYAVYGSGPCIVLIRGLGTQMIEWPDALIDGLVARGLQVVVFDNRDAGLSSKCESDYTLSDMAADVVGLLDGLQIAQAHIFGISLGGMVAQLVAVEHPQRCRSLISVMSGSGNPQVPTVRREALPWLLETAEGRDAVIALDALNRQRFGSPAYPEDEATRIAAATRAYERCHCPAGVARQMRAANADGSRVERLRNVTVPTLVIHGADDPLVDVAAGQDTAACVPGARLDVIDGMGHNIPARLAPEIVARVEAFIAQR